MRWAALVMVACGANAPPAVRNESDEPVGSLKAARHRYEVEAPRPEIDIAAYLPNFHEELRWPLGGMSHPKLEPSFPIANALASPGVSWLDLCALGAQHRHLSRDQDLVAYLRGWCSVVNGDVDNACRHLSPLFGSITRGLAAAVRADLANILVDLREADKAEHWLNKHNIRDIALLDLLAASFVEVGLPDEARTINRRVLDADNRASAATKCHRIARHIMLNGSDLLASHELEDLATKSKVPDPTCVELFEDVRCWQSRNQLCAPYFKRNHINEAAYLVLDVYDDWPRHAMPFDHWIQLGWRAIGALKLEGAGELVLVAYETAVRANREVCVGELRKNVGRVAKAIRDHSPNAAALEPRIVHLLDRCAP